MCASVQPSVRGMVPPTRQDEGSIVDEPVFRIIPAAQWPAVQLTGAVPPAPVDQRDGFIHLSDATTVLHSADLYFPPATHPIVLEIDPVVLGETLQWEYVESREALFPHLYAPALRVDSVVAIHELLHEGGRYRWGRRAVR